MKLKFLQAKYGIEFQIPENFVKVLNKTFKKNANLGIFSAVQFRPHIEEIQKKVAQHFNIKVSDMSSARRSRTVARPRQIAMYLSKNLTSRSLPEIGRRFGNRDHTTVIHAVRKVEELRNKDVSFDEDVQLLIRMLES